MKQDNNRPIFRLSGAMVISTAFAFSLAWPLAYLTPLFVWNFLKTPARFTFNSAVTNCISPLAGCLLGFATSLAALSNPIIFLAVTALLLWLIFYADPQELSTDTQTWLVIGLTLVPMLSLQSQNISLVIVGGLLASGASASVISWLAWLVLPGPSGPGQHVQPAQDSVKLCEHRRRSEATVNLAMVLPPVICIYLFNMPDKLLVIIFIALLVPAVRAGAGSRLYLGLLAGNMIGGVAALVMCWLLRLAPEPLFFLLVYWLSGLIFSWWTFSGNTSAPLGAMAFTTALLIVGGATMPFSEGAGPAMLTRLFNIGLVVVYFTVVMKAYALISPLLRTRPFHDKIPESA